MSENHWRDAIRQAQASTDRGAVDPHTVDWAAVKRGEIEAPQRIEVPERDEYGKGPDNAGGFITAHVGGSILYRLSYEPLDLPGAKGRAAVYSNDGHLLRVNADKPAAVAWETPHHPECGCGTCRPKDGKSVLIISDEQYADIKAAPEPAVVNPYPAKCMKCDNRLDDYGQCTPCLEPDWHKPGKKPADQTFATELPRGATFERWRL